MEKGFDSEKYLREQSEAILERAGHFGDKLYLEFGGKLICDYHAARVLPGFLPAAQRTGRSLGGGARWAGPRGAGPAAGRRERELLLRPTRDTEQIGRASCRERV